MIEVAGLALLRPLWLLAVPLAALIAVVAARRAGGAGDWRKAVDPHLLDALARRGGLVAGRGAGGLTAAVAAGAIALALSGPAIERQDVQSFRNLDAVVIALDLSKSVVDSPEFREAKIAALAAADAAGSRQIALVVYAGDAYLASPPTSDRKGLETTLFALDGQTVPDPGSAPSRALALAHRTLKEAQVVGGDVVLITDGGGVDEGTIGEARALAADGHAVSALHIAPAAAGPRTNDTAGRPELQALASAGGGLEAQVTAAAPVNARLGRATADRLGAGLYASLVWFDLGRFLLLAAAVPVLLLFRRSA